jgi:hypothetical protein
MKILPFLLASVAGAVVMFLLGFIIYVLLMGGMDPEAFPAEMGYRTNPDIGMIFLSNLFAAMIITLICGAWGKAYTFSSGTLIGAIFGALLSLTYGTSMMAFRTDMETGRMLLDVGLSLVVYGLPGGIISLILSRMPK